MFLETDEDGRRPMRRFIRTLPKLTMTEHQQIDFKAIDPALLLILASDAGATASIIQQGTGAIGSLLSSSAEALTDCLIGAATIQELGNFIAEISCISVDAMMLETLCRREIADYQPGNSPVR